MVGLLQICFLFNLLFILIKCNPSDALRVRKTDQKLIQRQRQDTRDMCKIFNSEVKSSLPTTPLLLSKYDKRKRELLKLKQKKQAIQNKKTRRIKRAVNSVNPANNIEDELRVESIVDKIYDDLLEKGQKIAYRRKEIPIPKASTRRKKYKGYTPAHKPGRRFPFAPSILDAEEKVTLMADPMIEELANSKPVRFANAIVPYFIDAKTYDTHLADVITRAFDYFEKATCIRLQRLRERPTDPRSLQNVTWLYISNPSGIRQCVHSNEKLQIQGVQHITLGYDCMSLGDISHEIMHVLGFAHEHVRPDRDQHITILWENIKPGYKQYFEIRNESIVEGLPYDYASVMHYPPRAFSKNGKPTILTERGIKIGQREALSEMDLEKISIMYSNECIKRNREYLLKTCPDVVRADVPQPINVTPQDINEYFKDKLWPYGVITYKFDTLADFSFEEKENIKAVMDHISNQTCVQFVDFNQTEGLDDQDDEDDSSSDSQFNTDELDHVVILASSSEDDTKSSDEDNKSVVPDSSTSTEKDSQFTTNDSESKEKMKDDDDNPWWNRTESSTSTETDSYFNTDEINNVVIFSSSSEDNTEDNDAEGKEPSNNEDKKGFIPDSSTSMEADPSLRFKTNSNRIRDSGTTVKKGVKLKDKNGVKGNKKVKRNNTKYNIKVKDASIGTKRKYTNVDGKVKTTMATRKRNVSRRQRAVPPTPARRHAAGILMLTRSDQLGCPCPPTGKPQDGSNPTLVINTDCFNTVNDLLHLFGHVLGLDHQQNMHDRDSYLHIQWDQLTEDVKHEMEPKLPPEASVGYPYDYHSVMHYPWLEIKYGKTNVMYPIWNDGWAMGHWQGLSVIDVEKIQRIYNQPCLERLNLEEINREKHKTREKQNKKDEEKDQENNDEDDEQDKNEEDDENENNNEDDEQDNNEEDDENENNDENDEQDNNEEDDENENNDEDDEQHNNEEDDHENENNDEDDKQDNNEEDDENENNDEDDEQHNNEEDDDANENNDEDDEQDNKEEDDENENNDEGAAQDNNEEDKEHENKNEADEHENNEEDDENENNDDVEALDNNEEDEEHESKDEDENQENNDEEEEQNKKRKMRTKNMKRNARTKDKKITTRTKH